MAESVLITGAGGFIGSHMAHHFAEKGHPVIALDKRFAEPFTKPAREYRVELPSPDLGELVKEVKPDLCVHCAGPSDVRASMRDPARDFQMSVTVTFHVLDTLRLHVPKCRFVFLSSAAVYGNPVSLPIPETGSLDPLSPYGYHKMLGEMTCSEMHEVYDLSTLVVRIFSAYGPGLRRQVLWDICQKAAQEPVVNLHGTGNESRDFINILDVVKAVYFLTQRADFKGEVYNLASGSETTIKTLAERVIASLGVAKHIQFNGVVEPGTPLRWKADVSRLRALGFSSMVPLEQGVRDFVDWFKMDKGCR